MGRGNFRPNNYIEERGFEMVYVDLEHDDDGDDNFFYENFREELATSLPNSFYAVNKWEGYHGNEIHIVHENGLFQIGLADNEWSTALIVMVKEDAPAFAKSNLEGVAFPLFNELAKYYKLKIRCGPWMSGDYVKK